jgi:hypothetical protein
MSRMTPLKQRGKTLFAEKTSASVKKGAYNIEPVCTSMRFDQAGNLQRIEIGYKETMDCAGWAGKSQSTTHHALGF